MHSLYSLRVNSRFFLFLCLSALMLPWTFARPAATSYTVSVDDKTGLPALTKAGVSAISPSYAFWGSKWAWAGMDSGMRVVAPFSYALVGKSQALELDLAGHVNRVSDNQLVWDLTLLARSARPDVIGGGMIFRFDLANFGAELGEPVLLPGNRGWAWGREGKARLEMRFEPPLAEVFFEQGKKTELRAYFYRGSIGQGSLHHTATLTTTGDMSVGPSTAERFGMGDPATWPRDALDWKISPVDLSFLNAPEAPAGKRGFVKAVGDRLQFSDGTAVRFWGTNLSGYTLFSTPKEGVRLQAIRLSKLGFNLVRLHHIDSPWVNPNIFGDSRTTNNTQRLNAQSLDRLDWWIKCLKDEGIYVWMDLHVQRAFTSADNVFGYDEMRKGKENADLKGYSYVSTNILSAMQRSNEAYVNHVNPYTGKANKDEPAIAAMLITNENDITNHYGTALLPDKQVPGHNRLYTAEANNFARAHNLPADKVWRAWEHGPSKLFLNDLERRFNAEMMAHLRGLGVQVPIATTSTWGDNPLSALPALTVGDVIDVHTYGGTGQLEKSPLATQNMAHWIAAGQVVGKPLTVSEWNAEPFPTPDRHTLPPFLAAMASHQGWDAMVQYAYSQEPFIGPGTASNWHAYNDPGLLATMPAAALMYRQGHVHDATTTYVFDPGADMLFNQNISAANAPALRTAAEVGKLLIAMPQTKELPWLVKSTWPAGAKILRDPGASIFPAGTTEATSDTGELVHNWGKGTYTINTARTQAAMGWLGGDTIVLKDVTIKAATRNATVVVQSLDGASIAQSRDLLISVGTRAVPLANNQVPFNVEPMEGEIQIRAPKGLKLSRRDAQLIPQDLLAAYRDGVYTIKLEKATQSNWFFLRAPPSSSRE